MLEKSQGTKEFFAENIKRLRKLKHWSQGELAQKLGVRANTISNYENGVSFPEPKMLDDLVKVLEISRAALFEGDDEATSLMVSDSAAETGYGVRFFAGNTLLDIIVQLESACPTSFELVSKLKTEIIVLMKEKAEADQRIIKLMEKML